MPKKSDFWKLKTTFSQNYPKRRQIKLFWDERITVDAQEKDYAISIMPYLSGLLQLIYRSKCNPLNNNGSKSDSNKVNSNPSPTNEAIKKFQDNFKIPDKPLTRSNDSKDTMIWYNPFLTNSSVLIN